MRLRRSLYLIPGLALLLTVATSQPAAADEPGLAALGSKIGNSNSLRDLRGNKRALHDLTGHKAIVLAFLGADCPVSHAYAPGLVELEKKYRAQQVQFVAVYANDSDDMDVAAAHALDHDLPFLVLKDFGQKLAGTLGVKRVPTMVVLDADFQLRYRGRIDDRYGVAARRPQPTRADLAEALDEVLAGKKVTVPETETDGCLLEAKHKAPGKAVTWTKQVAPILQKRCQECHRPGQSAPFSLVNYDDAVKHAAMLVEVTTQRRMPPWHADPRYGHLANDRRLSREELDTLTAWVDAGMPRGDDKDLPAPAAWPKGWVHGEPDLIIRMPEAFEVPAEGVLSYKNWIIDPDFKEDRWVRIAEARPGEASVVHHVVVYILRPGQIGPVGPQGGLSILVGWAPGDLGLALPPDTALRVPKGSKLRFEMHYTPNGKAVKDRSEVGLTFAKEAPKYELFIQELANLAFVIPPQNPHFKAEAAFRLRADARIISFAPHMHWRGQDFRYEVIYPDGKRETLLSVPRWDFNWQNVYRFAEPIKLPKGAKIHAVAHWDNTRNNPLNPAPDKSVHFGLQTSDEMMVGFVGYVWERPETAAEMAKNPPSVAEQLFDRLDVNGDDVLTPDEFPEQLKPLMTLQGMKVPEKITREEFNRLFERLPKGFGRPKKPEADKDEKKPQPISLEEKKPTLGGNFEVEATKDIAYYTGEDADPAKHKLDIYVPKGQKNFPVLFFIHGGTWSSGDRKLYAPLGDLFARNGVGTVVISYRLSPAVQHPAHAEDVARAFAWTVRNIGAYGGNPREIFVGGHSSGGHLAALLATNERFLKAEKVSRADIKGVIPLSGIYQLKVGTLPKIFGKDEETFRDASPLAFVVEKLPPFLIGYADNDMKDFDRMAEEFCKAIQAKKGEATTLKVADRSHLTIIIRLSLGDADPCTSAILDFIAQHTGRERVKKEMK